MNQDHNKPFITESIQDKVATISFYSPASNSFPSSQLEKLTSIITKLSDHPHINTIILKSEGTGAFCAGASLTNYFLLKILLQVKPFSLALQMSLMQCAKVRRYLLVVSTAKL